MKTAISICIFLSFAALGCGNFGLTENKTGSNGVWYGYAVDGRTGAKLNFFGENNNDRDGNSANQIWTVVEGKIRIADHCDGGDENSNNGLSLNGCFVIKKLPTNVELPVFAKMEGYHSFAGTIMVEGISDINDSENIIGEPAYYRNLRLFPQGIDYTYTITTEYNLAPLAGAEVNCIYRSQGDFDVLGAALPQKYVTPTNDFNPIISGLSDESGFFVIPGGSLTKGGLYECFATAIVDGNVISNAAGETFTVGVDDTSVLVDLN